MMRIRLWKQSTLLLVLLGVAGCDTEQEPPPEVARRRADAQRDACIATELLRRAEENVATLRETLGAGEDDDRGAEITRRAGAAALTFAEAYHQHATLRAAAWTRIDSAFNHATTPAESLRYTEAAERVRIRAPEPGTLEANVVSAYERDFLSIRQDEDHRCNWDVG